MMLVQWCLLPLTLLMAGGWAGLLTSFPILPVTGGLRDLELEPVGGNSGGSGLGGSCAS